MKKIYISFYNVMLNTTHDLSPSAKRIVDHRLPISVYEKHIISDLQKHGIDATWTNIPAGRYVAILTFNNDADVYLAQVLGLINKMGRTISVDLYGWIKS